MSTKKIVYLFGAGATEAVIKNIDPEMGLMTEDIRKKIIETIEGKNTRLDNNTWNTLITEKIDIEQLISILESQHDYASSNTIRKYYYNALSALANDLFITPPVNLYVVLSDLHWNVKAINEELLCYITLNYEDILEKSLITYFGYEVDYFLYNDVNKNQNKQKNKVKILKLHGSFNWRNRRPIQVQKVKMGYERTLWIPPGVEKKRDNYPFNMLWGKATEFLMEADIVRIVGCSLNRNDWNLVPMLFTIQQLCERKKLQIEIVDFPWVKENIQSNYQCLHVKGITELDEMVAFSRHQFTSGTEDDKESEIRSWLSNKDKTNPFQIWLEAKIAGLVDRSLDIKTEKGFVYKFFHKEEPL